MYRTILVPLDTSAKNKAVLRRARHLADPSTSRIVLFHAVEMLQDVEFEEMEDFYEDLKAQAQSVLDDWASSLADEGFSTETEVTFGERGPSIVEAVDTHDVDCIVLRSHVVDHDNPEESLGTVSHQVALFAPCSVLMVRE
jgi:nucleotide-binding universal stress UspA family protein